VYTEFNIPWTKEFTMNASARYDDYTAVGGSASGKLSARWQPIEQLLFRAAFGSGFRAPTLVELHLPQSVGSTEQFIDPANAADGPVQPNAINSGNTNLKPEKSKQFSLGVGFSPIKSLTLSVDYFNIKIDDYIIKPAALGLVKAAEAGHPLYGPKDVLFSDGSYVFVPGSAQTVDTVDQTLRNAASAKVDGVDVSLDWSDTFAIGKVGVNLTGTKMLTYDLTTLAGVQKSVGTIVQPDGSPLDIAGLGVVASWKHVLTLSWSLATWGASLTQNYYAGYDDAFDTNGNPHRVPAQSIFDAQVTFAGIPHLTLALGARNLTDKDPPLFIGNGASFQFGYDPTIYDPRGRFVYLRATYKAF
jgi:iron complex outermembrane recepter protein